MFVIQSWQSDSMFLMMNVPCLGPGHFTPRQTCTDDSKDDVNRCTCRQCKITSVRREEEEEEEEEERTIGSVRLFPKSRIEMAEARWAHGPGSCKGSGHSHVEQCKAQGRETKGSE